MSTGFECNLIEESEGVWWYLLQNWDCPVGAGDWREYATLYGPHTTEEASLEHLRANHARPGGYSMATFRDETYPFKPDAVFERLKTEAVERAKAEAARPAYRPYRW